VDQLVWSSGRGDLNRVEALLKEGAPINGIGAFSRVLRTRPLIAASAFGKLSVVDRLLKAGASVDAADESQFGINALLIAAWRGHIEILRLLLANGANVNFTDKASGTAWLYANGAKHDEITTFLNEKGSASVRTDTIVNFIINFKSLPDCSAEVEQQTYICYPTTTQPSKAAGKTQDNGFKIRQATAAGDAETVTKLVSAKATVNLANTDGVTPLMIASANGQVKIVTVLLKAGADVEAKTSTQQVTALMFASLCGHLEVARALVDGGANIKASDKDKNAAIDYSILVFKDETKEQKENALAVGKYLRSKGAEVKLTQENFLGRLLTAYSGDEALALIEHAKAEKQ